MASDGLEPLDSWVEDVETRHCPWFEFFKTMFARDVCRFISGINSARGDIYPFLIPSPKHWVTLAAVLCERSLSIYLICGGFLGGSEGAARCVCR